MGDKLPMPTRGPWSKARLYTMLRWWRKNCPWDDEDMSVPQDEREYRDIDDSEGNINLLYAVSIAATEAADMGFDPIGAVQALPQLLRAARMTDDGTAGFRPATVSALAAARTRREP